MMARTVMLLLALLLAACSDKGSEKFSGNASDAVATYGSCAFCHDGLAARMTERGGHKTTALKCQTCHLEQMPGDVGPQHRSIPACANCHPTQQTHPGALASGSCMEELDCSGCHTPHGSTNLALVRTRIETPDCEIKPITFTNRAGRADGSFASLTTPGTGVCEVCHSSTAFYRSDGGGAPHFTTTCSSEVCHSHARSFVPLVPSATATADPTTTASPTPTVPPESTPTPTEAPITQLDAQLVTLAPTGIDDPIWDSIAPLRPDLGDVRSGALYGDGRLNMTGTFDGLAGFNGGNAADLKLRAAHDGTSLYILAEWNDSRFDLDRDRWLYNGPPDSRKPEESAAGWTSQRNEDRIAFAFEIEAASSSFGSFTTVGCAAGCHDVGGGDLEMQPQAGAVDLWQWRAALSAPLGSVADEITDAAAGRRADEGASTAIRNAANPTDNRSGPALEWDGTTQTFTRPDGVVVALDPAYILLEGHTATFDGDAAAGDVSYQASCAVCHGINGQGGIGPAVNQPASARQSRAELDAAMAASSHPGSTAYNALSASAKTNLLARLRGFSGISGYVLAQPEGSAADVLAQANVSYDIVDDLRRSTYRVMLSRRLATGNADDVQFSPGIAYPFGVALMDNDGINHIGTPRETLSLEAAN